MTAVETRINELFDELVPPSGKADTVAGEIIRAISRIGYRYFNDGDRIGIGYGRETCNPAARYLLTVCNDEVKKIIDEIWGVYLDSVYEEILDRLKEAVLNFVESNPELKTTPNGTDMWDCKTDEDVDDGDEEEEEWW